MIYPLPLIVNREFVPLRTKFPPNVILFFKDNVFVFPLAEAILFLRSLYVFIEISCVAVFKFFCVLLCVVILSCVLATFLLFSSCDVVLSVVCCTSLLFCIAICVFSVFLGLSVVTTLVSLVFSTFSKLIVLFVSAADTAESSIVNEISVINIKHVLLLIFIKIFPPFFFIFFELIKIIFFKLPKFINP